MATRKADQLVTTRPITLVVCCLMVAIVYGDQKTGTDDPEARDEIGKSTSDLIRLRNFEALDYYIDIEPGVTLNLVRIINPTLKGLAMKKPVLFIHGILSNANYFLINSIDSRPSNWSHLNVSSMTLDQLQHHLANEPISKSLPLLMSNLGYDVWLLNRRPTKASQSSSMLSHLETSTTYAILQGVFQTLYELNPFINRPTGSIFNIFNAANDKISLIEDMGLISPNILQNILLMNNQKLNVLSDNLNRQLYSNYWNFSLDEQASKDLPKVIDFIIARNNNGLFKKVSIVSHSTGGAITLMLLCRSTHYADKIDKTALFAPAMHLGSTKDDNILISMLTRLEPIMTRFAGPIEPLVFAVLMEIALFGFCTTGQVGEESCTSLTDAFDGLGSNQLESNAAFSLASADTTGTHEFAQLLQSMIKGKMHEMDFGSDYRNNQVYGVKQRSVYNTKQINRSKLSIWQGNTDKLVTRADSEELIRNLGVPVDYHYIDGPGIMFDHSAFLTHKNVSSLLNIPALRYLG